MKKFILFIIGLYVGIIIFAPKENLIYTLQNYLKKQNVFINTKIESNLFSINLKDFTIFINKMDLIKGENLNILPTIFYNKFKAKNIKINFQNLKIDNLTMLYSIINPTDIIIEGKGNFGQINGTINILKKEAKIYIIKPISSIKSFLKKDKKGYYFYEKF